MKKSNHNISKFLEKRMNRKEAIKKVGVTALTTATMVFLATKAKAQTSPPKAGDPESLGDVGTARNNRR